MIRFVSVTQYLTLKTLDVFFFWSNRFRQNLLFGLTIRLEKCGSDTWHSSTNLDQSPAANLFKIADNRAMKSIFLMIILFVLPSHAKECRYPAEPINWILKYCAYETQTDDEIAIQESPCFKAAQIDLSNVNKCNKNRKYC